MDGSLRKVIAIGFVGLAVVTIVRRLLTRAGSGWETRLEKMPDTSPPKWMFTNIGAIRENTDEILERMKAAP